LKTLKFARNVGALGLSTLFLQSFFKLPVYPKTYGCLFFRQNGGDSLLQEEENLNPQLFHIGLWIREKNLSEEIVSDSDSTHST
jgi:hypothetical protein